MAHDHHALGIAPVFCHVRVEPRDSIRNVLHVDRVGHLRREAVVHAHEDKTLRGEERGLVADKAFIPKSPLPAVDEDEHRQVPAFSWPVDVQLIEARVRGRGIGVRDVPRDPHGVLLHFLDCLHHARGKRGECHERKEDRSLEHQ